MDPLRLIGGIGAMINYQKCQNIGKKWKNVPCPEISEWVIHKIIMNLLLVKKIHKWIRPFNALLLNRVSNCKAIDWFSKIETKTINEEIVHEIIQWNIQNKLSETRPIQTLFTYIWVNLSSRWKDIETMIKILQYLIDVEFY